MTTKKLSTTFQLALLVGLSAARLHAYEALQGPTELLYWDKTNTYPGYLWGVAPSPWFINNQSSGSLTSIVVVVQSGERPSEYAAAASHLR